MAEENIRNPEGDTLVEQLGHGFGWGGFISVIVTFIEVAVGSGNSGIAEAAEGAWMSSVAVGGLATSAMLLCYAPRDISKLIQNLKESYSSRRTGYADRRIYGRRRSGE